MRTIMFVVIMFIIFIPFYCTFDDNVTKYPTALSTDSDPSDLPCCNNNSPFVPNGICPDDDALVSLACNDDGVKSEKSIKCSCCKEIWIRFGDYPNWQNIPCESVGGSSGLYCTEVWKY